MAPRCARASQLAVGCFFLEEAMAKFWNDKSFRSGDRMGKLPDGAWSRFWPRCQSCQSTEKKHHGRGFCVGCYRRAVNAR